MDTLRPYFTENHGRLCDGTVGGTFIWRDYHRSEYALEDGIFYLKVEYPEVSYALPRGKAIDKAAYDKIIEQCALEGIPALLCAVAEKDVTTLTGMYPNSEIRTDRSCSDYLYLSSDLVGLAGRKYSGQRNHINRFTREHQTWSFEHITPANLSAVREYYKKYALEHYKDAPAYLEGDRKAMEVLDNLEAYEIFGGALYVGDEIIGVSFGEIMGDTLFVHAEKADTEHHGAYPMLMNQFAAAFTSEDVIYINREEDDGDEGLRTSKLSYHPTEILHKYTIELK
ncbi:MAG: phosphatidylglycerol lysyltransferase domain-containing protein [Oscillospiraceae bacterium]|nr:phosphatidylglycerol lysyltransferase domain-containing protein [Oscillospiraceae bacterium]